jgi:hypothetical protein
MEISPLRACRLLACCLALAASPAWAAGAGQAGGPIGNQYSVLYSLGDDGLQLVSGTQGKAQAYGVVDAEKRIVIPPRYSMLKPFYSKGKFMGVLAFKLPGSPLCGLVDAKGQVLVPAEFDSCPGYFDDNGLGKVVKGQRNGLVDLSGRLVVLAPKNFIIESFDPASHVAKVEGQHNNIGMVDAQGRFLLPPDRYHIGDFDARGFASLEKGGKEGMIDRSGRVRIPPKYDDLDLLLTADLQGKPCHRARLGRKYGYVDDDGNVVVPFEFEELDFPSEKTGETMMIGKKNGKFGAIGQDGQVAIPFIYEGLSWLAPEGEKPLASGKSWFRAEYQGRFGTLGQDGKWDIAPKFEGLGKVGNNGWIVAEQGCDYATGQGCKIGYVDGQGQWKIPPRFDDAKPFVSGNQRSFAALRIKPGCLYQYCLRWGIIDEKGNWVLKPAFAYPPAYNKFTPFGVAAVQVAPDAKQPAGCFFPCCCQGLVDKNGKWVVPPVFGSIQAYAWARDKTPYVEAEYMTPGHNTIYGNRLYPDGKIEYGTYQREICGVQVNFDKNDHIATIADKIRASRACARQGMEGVLQGLQ